MDWERDPDERRRTGRAGTAVVLAVAVAVVAWLARSPATAPDQLAVDPPPSTAADSPGTPAPVATPLPASPDPEPVDLLGLDTVLPVRAGGWEEMPAPPTPRGPGLQLAPPATADRPAGPPPAHVWDGDELVVLSGRDGRALDPGTGTWRPVPGYPGNPSADKAVTALRRGIVVVDQLIGPQPGEISSGAMWLLRPDGGWDPLPRPPTDQVWSVTEHPLGLIATGRGPADRVAVGQGDVAAAPSRADAGWLLEDGAAVWTALPALPRALDGLRAFATRAGVVVLGVVAAPELDRNVIAAGELGAAGYLLDASATGWQPLADPPAALAAGSQVVAVAASGAAPDRVLLLDGTDPREVVRLHTYDVGADEWTAREVELPPRAATVLGGFPWLSASDGAGSAWFSSPSQSPLLVVLDPATGRVALVVPQAGAARGSGPIPFPGGVLLAGGVDHEADGTPVWSTRIHRWTASPSPD